MDVIKEECRVKVMIRTHSKIQLHVLDVQASELSGLPAKRVYSTRIQNEV